MSVLKKENKEMKNRWMLVLFIVLIAPCIISNKAISADKESEDAISYTTPDGYDDPAKLRNRKRALALSGAPPTDSPTEGLFYTGDGVKQEDEEKTDKDSE